MLKIMLFAGVYSTLYSIWRSTFPARFTFSQEGKTLWFKIGWSTLWNSK